MVRLRTPAENVTAKSRLVGIRLAVLTLRMRETWRHLFGDDDAALIALATVATNSDRMLRAALDPDLESLENALSIDDLSRCNVNSIVAATGLNRETARRKVVRLIEEGLLVREQGRLRLAPGFTQQRVTLETVRTQLDQLRRAVEDLIRLGAINFEP